MKTLVIALAAAMSAVVAKAADRRGRSHRLELGKTQPSGVIRVQQKESLAGDFAELVARYAAVEVQVGGGDWLRDVQQRKAAGSLRPKAPVPAIADSGESGSSSWVSPPEMFLAYMSAGSPWTCGATAVS